MQRHVLVSLLTLALFAASAMAAPQPIRATVTGKISALNGKKITIDGARDVTCKVASITPKALGYHIGTPVKASCIRGVLVSITRAASAPKSSGTLAPRPHTQPSPPRLGAPSTR